MLQLKFFGIGGQGVVTGAKILSKAVSLYEDEYAVTIPSYGHERRGAPVNTSMIVDKEPVLDRPKGSLAHYLGPIQSKVQTLRLAVLLATHPLSTRGCTERTRPVQTNPNVSLHILHVPAINSLAVTLPTIS